MTPLVGASLRMLKKCLREEGKAGARSYLDVEGSMNGSLVVWVAEVRRCAGTKVRVRMLVDVTCKMQCIKTN